LSEIESEAYQELFFFTSLGRSFRFSHLWDASYRIHETSAHGLKQLNHFTSRCITQLNGYLTQRVMVTQPIGGWEKRER